MSFSQQLKRANHKIVNDKLEDARRKILLRLFRSVVYDTPVLEGTLRGNWQLTTDAPASGTLDVKGKNSGKATFENISNGVIATDFGDTVYLTNNLPYAYPIEFLGWSHTKAPEGMVRKNIARLNRIAAAVAREVNR